MPRTKVQTIKKHNEYVKGYAKQRRDVFAAKLRDFKARGCMACPENDPVAIELHHWRGEKAFEISVNAWGRRPDLVEEEFAKVVRLCRNCHAKAHAHGPRIFP